VVLLDFTQEFLREMRPLGPGADNAHVTFQNVEKLRQFIEAAAPQQSADPGSARVILRGPRGIAVRGLGYPHRTELVHRKNPSLEPDSALHKKNRPGRTQLYRSPNEDRERGRDNHRKYGEEDVKGTFHDDVLDPVRGRSTEIDNVDAAQMRELFADGDVANFKNRPCRQ